MPKVAGQDTEEKTGLYYCLPLVQLLMHFRSTFFLYFQCTRKSDHRNGQDLEAISFTCGV
ncbi:hypothetical protein BDV37DRAFT_261062 [Aspergillus pseudonomiae]|uniref:Uncharacterized protein n=1 Tax=Aspergillus pseudonomiae TaxID=1506151 RepID=A0A5N7D079_9EURO|nr:uncharacterized protein BDV37DRAFT_261062 [Aspergillus pseudonomiae]KAE8399263.1 hypothetical protein BDV37DRAFT_261062 [Aspergillus pseudonomiae]